MGCYEYLAHDRRDNGKEMSQKITSPFRPPGNGIVENTLELGEFGSFLLPFLPYMRHGTRGVGRLSSN